MTTTQAATQAVEALFTIIEATDQAKANTSTPEYQELRRRTLVSVEKFARLPVAGIEAMPGDVITLMQSYLKLQEALEAYRKLIANVAEGALDDAKWAGVRDAIRSDPNLDELIGKKAATH